MYWKGIFEISTEALIETGEFDFQDYKIFLSEHPSQNGQFRILTIFIVIASGDLIEDAYFKCLNAFEDFSDRFCIISYSRLDFCFLQLMKDTIRIGEEFDILSSDYIRIRDLNVVKLNNLNFKIENGEEENQIRLLRQGLNTNSFEEKFLKYYTFLENIASVKCKETIKVKCDNCNHEKDSGRKATNNFIRNELLENGILKGDIDKIKKLRQYLSHGGGKRDKNYFYDINRFSVELETICAKKMLKELGISSINSNKMYILGTPLQKGTYKFDEEKKIHYIKKGYETTFKSVQIDTNVLNGCKVGFTMEQVIHFGFPEIEE